MKFYKMSKREQILERLKSFYARNDPQRRYKTFDPMLNYAMAEGLDKLNKLLFKKYGDKIELDSFPTYDRGTVRHKVELYYLKHDPKKIDNPEDIEAIVEFVLVHGEQELDLKLFEKYSEKLSGATFEDAVDMIKLYYKKLKLIKSKDDCELLVKWGLKNSFCALNQRLIKKYGKGLGELDSKMQKKNILKQLIEFYEVYDPSQLEDENNMSKRADWTLKHGVQKLNQKLQSKYMANLNTIKKKVDPPPPNNLKDMDIFPEIPPPNVTRSVSCAETESKSISSNAQERAAEDEVRIQKLRAYANLFLAKHDTDRLYNGGVRNILHMLRTHGEQKVEDELCSEYGEGLKSIEQQYVELEKKLELFYKIYDTERLKLPLDNLIGWAIVHGEDKLNEKLMSKYDEDLEGAGLKKRLRIFYHKVGEDRSEAELTRIALYAMEKGLQKLNRRLKKKYGKSLEDVFAMDEHIIEEGSYISDRLTQATWNSKATSETFQQRANRTARQAVQSYAEKNFHEASVSMVEVNKIKEPLSSSVSECDTNLEDYPHNEESGILHQKTKKVEDIKTERQEVDSGEKLLESTFTVDDLDMRKGNRKSLKLMRQRRGSTKPLNTGGAMTSKLRRFLEHVDEYRAAKQEGSVDKENVDVVMPKEVNNEEGFSFQMSSNKNSVPVNQSAPSVLIREKKAANNLVTSLLKFYKRHDKRKANPRSIRLDVDFTLKHGKEALNAKLLRQYGESLNSLRTKNKLRVDKKKMKAIQSKRDFTVVPRESMIELDKFLKD